MNPLFQVRNLFVSHQGLQILKDVTLHVKEGEIVGLVGESGCGKTTLSHALMGFLPQTYRWSGTMLWKEAAPFAVHASDHIASMRLNAGFVFQDPVPYFNPVRTLKAHMEKKRAFLSAGSHRERVSSKALPCDDPFDITSFLPLYPHQVSGGQCQRVMIALAFDLKPRLVIADEPFSSLDKVYQKKALDFFRDKARLGTGILVIGHQIQQISSLANRIYVMREGAVIEEVSPPWHLKNSYTKRIFQPFLCVPPPRPLPDNTPLTLEVVDFECKKKWATRLLDPVSFSLKKGETLGIIGPSGAGKSTLAQALFQVLSPCKGSVFFHGKNLVMLSAKHLKPLRRFMAILFQDSSTSLNPYRPIGYTIAEGLWIHRLVLNKKEASRQVIKSLEDVGLGASYQNRYPHELSGGQRQRACLARALALKPNLLVLDEPTTGLDPSAKESLLVLLRTFQDIYHISYLFISHERDVLEAMSHRIFSVEGGRLVPTPFRPMPLI